MKKARLPLWSWIRFDRIWNSRISLLGLAMTTVSAVIMISALILDISTHSSTYRGLIAYTVMPMFFILGLLLIPLGIWRVYRKGLLSGQAPQPLVIDLGRRDHRRRLLFFLGLTAINVLILSVILYEGYHYTDSNAFCGTLCHQVMSPEYTAYQGSPHARVRCVQCHIGGGASWYVKSKVSGLRQVWAVMRGNYSRPIPSPVENLRPARETCEECHWPQIFHGSRLLVRRQAGDTPEEDLLSAVKLRIGGMNAHTGRYEGIHWHVSADNRIEYLAGDQQRLKINQVRVTREGKTRLFQRTGEEGGQGDEAAWRTMDCVDCHNRPSHQFKRAEDEVDRAILAGKLPRLPGFRSLAIELLKKTVQDEAQYATQSTEEIKKVFADLSDMEISRISQELTTIRKAQVFPDMKVFFGTYPSHLGHRDEPWGCFRCHDEQLVSGEKAISQDCELCHQLLLQEEPFKSLSPEMITQLELQQ